jgi:hypothetical protein
MAENLAAMTKRDEKKCLEKEAVAVIYLNLTKEVIEVQKMDVEAKKADTEAKTCAKDIRIMLVDLSKMDDDTRTWFTKKRAEIHARDA